MSTIDKNADMMTLVNVFTVKPENQEKLVTLQTEAAAIAEFDPIACEVVESISADTFV